VLTTMRFIRVEKQAARARSECWLPCFRFVGSARANFLHLSIHSVIDSTKGGGCVYSQFLAALLTSMIFSRFGTVSSDACMKLENSAQCRAIAVDVAQVKVVQDEARSRFPYSGVAARSPGTVASSSDVLWRFVFYFSLSKFSKKFGVPLTTSERWQVIRAVKTVGRPLH